jgi:hypothetical protein
VVSFTPRPLYPREKSSQYPLDTRLGGPQNQYGCYGEDKILDPIRPRTPFPRSSNPTTLSWLLYVCYLLWGTGITQYSCGLDGRILISQQGQRIFLHSFHISSRALPAPPPMDTRCSFARVKWSGHKVNNSTPSSAEVKNGRAIPPLPHTSSWLHCLID